MSPSSAFLLPLTGIWDSQRSGLSSDWEAEDAKADRTLLSSTEEPGPGVFTGEPQMPPSWRQSLQHPSLQSVQTQWLTSANRRKKGDELVLALSHKKT